MDNLFGQAHSAYQIKNTNIGRQLFSGQGGANGWMLHKQLRFGSWVVSFIYRLASEGDRGTVKQYNDQSHRVGGWPQGLALTHYYNTSWFSNFKNDDYLLSNS